ncbi:MAG: tetratricopeptide repeat protein [Bryobacterales bacterium]|nr:tetratricopeptide repeat protein [Bryobacterales bacterium]
MPRAREAARRALELDPSLPEASALLGTVAAAYDYDWEEAKRRLDLALHRSAVPPLVHRQYAFYYLLPTGRREEAAQEYRRAVEQDPLNVQFRYGVGICLAAAERFAESESEFRLILEIYPLNGMALSLLALLSPEGQP